MIFLFHGSDANAARAKAFAWVAAARAKEPQLLYTRIDGGVVTGSVLEEVSGAGGLFVKRLLVLIDEPFSQNQKEAQILFEKHLDALAASDNAILILAPELDAAYVQKIVPLATKTYTFHNAQRVPSARGFNNSLVNALATRNANALWLEIARALRAGDAPEALHGLLHWKARDLMKKKSQVWTPREARLLSLRLIKLLSEARRTGTDLKAALERFALSMHKSTTLKE